MFCILVGGMPASGKSHLARRLSQSLGLPMFSKDDIKERLFDAVGFRGRAEKVALGVGAMEILYYAADQVMAAGGSVILENNFERASLPGLRALLDRHPCRPVTLMLTGDPEVIYRRFLERDQSPQRHRGHVVNTAYPELPGERPPYTPVTLEQFVAGFTARGMGDFDPGGPRVTVDVTDFSALDYQGLVEQVRALMGEDAPDFAPEKPENLSNSKNLYS